MSALGLRPATPAELPAWSSATAARLGRLRQLAGRVDAEGALAEGEAVVADFLDHGVPRAGHDVLALLGTVAAQPVGWLWLHTVDDTRGRVAQVQDVWFVDDALPDDVSAADVMVAVERAVAGADLLKVATYTADPLLTAVVAGRGFEPDVLQLRLWLDDDGLVLDGPGTAAATEVRLEPLSGEGFDRWWAGQEEAYADELVQAGLVAPEHSRERSRTDVRRLLPDGASTPGQDFWSAVVGDVEVGVMWVAVRERRAFVFDVLVHPQHRRRGHARAMLRALHESLRERGTTSVGLSVFGWNAGARALYAQLGYQPVEVLLSRRLPTR